MLQRIQSVYLLSSLSLMCLLFLYPFITYMTPMGNVEYCVFGFKEGSYFVMKTIPMTILVGASAAISLLSIILFKRRMIQIRLCSYNIILFLGIYILGAYYIFSQVNFNVEHISTYNIGLLFPLFAIIFTYLALRAIGKDEALVRSVDRIR